jgi:hypothetical protein
MKRKSTKTNKRPHKKVHAVAPNEDVYYRKELKEIPTVTISSEEEEEDPDFSKVCELQPCIGACELLEYVFALFINLVDYCPALTQIKNGKSGRKKKTTKY